jgi:hypothetical protein
MRGGPQELAYIRPFDMSEYSRALFHLALIPLPSQKLSVYVGE